MVLVGHSYAGMVISAVAERVPGRIADVMPVTRVLIDRAAAGAKPWRIPPIESFGITDPADVA
ncbi:hypothetical protein [Actinoplanes sp. G11-F43]|uniref:hypothetical protein n=1 Tax=Actinoplanes sp. G11-F43 TaxID=3424130 RepID=UPI003D3472E3